ncbi:MAG: hypothetical protein IKC63_02795 [Clostridia bacterium]|nr:hypothetical protein [Clostridia bacterium]
MNQTVTVETLKALSMQYHLNAGNEYVNVAQWAVLNYAPALLTDYETTFAFIDQMTKSEFDSASSFFGAMIRKFQSLEMVEKIETVYHRFYSTTNNELYRETVANIRNFLMTE